MVTLASQSRADLYQTRDTLMDVRLPVHHSAPATTNNFPLPCQRRCHQNTSTVANTADIFFFPPRPTLLTPPPLFDSASSSTICSFYSLGCPSY